jgi:hypothetical protein
MSETDAAPDAARSDKIDRLRRLAFGRTSNVAEESAAEAALVELARIDAQIDAEREAARLAAIAAAESVEPSPGESTDLTAVEPVEAPPSRWRRWAAPAAVGLVAGALIATGVVFALPPAASTAPAADPAADATRETIRENGESTNVNYFLGDLSGNTTSSDGTIAGMSATGGDLEAAAAWFAEPQTEEDLVDVGSLLPEFDRGSVRLVHASSIARAWVAKRVDGQLCLEVTVRQTDYTSGSCALPPDFSESGLTVSSDPITVRWNGSQVNVLLAREPAAG